MLIFKRCDVSRLGFFTVRPFLFFTAVLRRKGAIACIARAAACERARSNVMLASLLQILAGKIPAISRGKGGDPHSTESGYLVSGLR